MIVKGLLVRLSAIQAPGCDCLALPDPNATFLNCEPDSRAARPRLFAALPAPLVEQLSLLAPLRLPRLAPPSLLHTHRIALSAHLAAQFAPCTGILLRSEETVSTKRSLEPQTAQSGFAAVFTSAHTDQA